MTKLTDEQIMKAIDCCPSYEGCHKCPMNKVCFDLGDLMGQIADYINRLNSDNEKLKKEQHLFADIGKMYSEVRAEAVKEFKERLLKELHSFDLSGIGVPDYDKGYESCFGAVEDTIDVVYEEMVGEG